MITRLSFLLFSFLLLLSGCVFHSGYKDESLDNQYSDASIKTNISVALLKKDATIANHIEVYSFNGHVFIIGEAPENFRKFAVLEAKGAEGITSVTSHWFPDGTLDKINDAALAAEIEGKLMFNNETSSINMEVVSWGRNILLLGFMSDQENIQKAIEVAREQFSVESVTSYLLTSHK